MAKSIIRKKLVEKIKNMDMLESDHMEIFVESIDKLPLELVRQFLGRFSELEKLTESITYDLLTIVSQSEE